MKMIVILNLSVIKEKEREKKKMRFKENLHVQCENVINPMARKIL
jgi:hypothetical protein